MVSVVLLVAAVSASPQTRLDRLTVGLSTMNTQGRLRRREQRLRREQGDRRRGRRQRGQEGTLEQVLLLYKPPGKRKRES